MKIAPLIYVVVGIALAGCAGPVVVVMKNPQTGEIVQCKGMTTGLSSVSESWAARDCANGYTAAGWTRLN